MKRMLQDHSVEWPFAAKCVNPESEKGKTKKCPAVLDDDKMLSWCGSFTTSLLIIQLHTGKQDVSVNVS